MSPTLEERARKTVGGLLSAAGWILQDCVDANIEAGLGVTTREFPLGRGLGEADYMLFADGHRPVPASEGGIDEAINQWCVVLCSSQFAPIKCDYIRRDRA